MDDLIAYLEAHSGLFAALAGIATVVGTLVGCCIQYFKMRRQKSELAEKVDDLQKERIVSSAKIATLEQKNRQSQDDCQRIHEEKNGVTNTLTTERDQNAIKVKELSQVIEDKTDELDERDRAIQRQKNLVSKMMKLEGQLWEKRALTGRPMFKPLQSRQSAIVSILNLKGGVGKTTITAHLACAFAAKGYRVLLIDLDLQGSLSGMFLDASLLTEKFHQGQLLQHFLNTATHKRKVNLLDYVQPIFDDGKSGIVATSDKLAYAEMNLTMSWLLRLANKDTRFLLRRALHLKRIQNHYDIVLLDCPPLINTCCVNALAASDYVLIPVTPGKKSTERVPQILDTVRRFRTYVNPSLEVAGVVLNRTHTSQLTAGETDLWKQVLAQGQDQLGVPVYGFTTTIRQNKEVRQSESAPLQLHAGSELFDTFRKIATELEGRFPSECRRFATASY